MIALVEIKDGEIVVLKEYDTPPVIAKEPIGFKTKAIRREIMKKKLGLV